MVVACFVGFQKAQFFFFYYYLDTARILIIFNFNFSRWDNIGGGCRKGGGVVERGWGG